MSDRRKAVVGALALAFLVLAGSGAARSAQTTAPDFTLPNVGGKSVTLSQLLKKGPVVLDFWATWCKPCIKAFPELQQVFDSYKDCGLTLVAVSIDGPKSASRVGALIKSKGNTFEVVLDTSQEVARKYHVTSVPRTVLINTKGEVVYAVTGYRPENHAELEAAVKALFPGGCPKPAGTE